MRVVRAKELAGSLGVDRSTLWRWAKVSDFPKAYKLGPNTVAWDEAEVKTWLEGRRVAREQSADGA